MSADPLCEPIEVDPLRLVRARRISRPGPAPAPERFAHFHDVAELVWFGQASGTLLTAQGAFALGPGTAVFLPSMLQHDFAIGPGPHDWIVVHVDAGATAAPGHDRALVVAGAGAVGERLAMLFGWLADLDQAAADHRTTARLLVELILAALAEAAPAAMPAAATPMTRIDRLRPALDCLARDPAAALTLSQAAALCHLSDSYFSRRFKAVFGTNFSDYLRGYRLRLAARRLVTGGARVAQIGYETGFATPAHFAAAFRARYGLSPRAYRERARAGSAALGQDDDSF